MTYGVGNPGFVFGQVEKYGRLNWLMKSQPSPW
jgi:hypothetical protein